MDMDVYRLWQGWQQMTYPSRGLPERDSERSVLIRIDGTLAPIFQRAFGRRPRGHRLSAQARATLESCQEELDPIVPALSRDGRRYFGRVQLLIRLALAANE